MRGRRVPDPCSLVHGLDPKDMQPFDPDDPVAVLGDMNGIKLYKADDGRVVMEFAHTGQVFHMAVPNDRAAAGAIRAWHDDRLAFDETVRRLNKAYTTASFDTPQEPTSLEELLPQIRTLFKENDGLPGTEELSRYITGDHGDTMMNKVTKFFSETLGMAKFVPVGESFLRSMGPWGRGLADVYRANNDMKARLRGWSVTEVDKVAQTLNEKELIGGLHDYITQGVLPDPSREPILRAAYNRLMEIQNQFYASAKSVGVKVAPELEEYLWPHRYDVGALGNEHVLRRLTDRLIAQGIAADRPEAYQIMEKVGFGTSRERVVREIAEKIIKRSTDAEGMTKITMPQAWAEAETVVRDFVEGQGERFASSLERARKLSDNFYIKDIRAWTITFLDNARRISEAVNFGPKDERLYYLMGQLKTKISPEMYSVAHDLFDFETGRKNVAMPYFFRRLMDWQAAKLSLSALTNLSGIPNTIAHVGLWNTLKAAGSVTGQHFKYGITGIRRAHHEMLGELVSSGAVSGVPNVYGGGETGASQMVGAMMERLAGGAYTHAHQLMSQETFPQRMKDLINEVPNTVARISSSLFNVVELSVNRALAQKAGEHYFDDTVAKLLRAPLGSRSAALYERRLKELQFDPAAVRRMVANGAKVELDEMRTMAGARVVRDTQFRTDFQNLPMLSQMWIGRLLLQFKTYPINQMRFILRSLNPADLPRFARTVAALTTAYPALGLAINAAKGNLVGETLTGAKIDELINEPGLGPMLGAAMLALTTSGTLGIALDVAATTAAENRYQMMSFAIAPTFATILSAASAAGAGANALFSDDADPHLATMYKTLASEVGGAGQMIIRKGFGGNVFGTEVKYRGD